MTTLEAALEAAVNRSVTLPVSERPAFIGRCLIASHYGREPPHSPESNITEDAAVLLRQMQELQTTLSAALNAARGQPGWRRCARSSVSISGTRWLTSASSRRQRCVGGVRVVRATRGWRCD